MRDRGEAGGGWAKPVQVGALVSVVIVSVILLGLASSQSGRMRSIERRVKSNRDEIGRLADRSGAEDAAADVAELRQSVGRLRTGVDRLDTRLEALESDKGGEALSRSVAELTETVREMSDELAEVRRAVEKRPRAQAAAAAPAGPDVTAEDIDALSGRITKLEEAAAELDDLMRKVADGSSKVRINEKALNALLEKLVDEQVKEALDRMREQFLGGRRRRPAP